MSTSADLRQTWNSLLDLMRDAPDLFEQINGHLRGLLFDRVPATPTARVVKLMDLSE